MITVLFSCKKEDSVGKDNSYDETKKQTLLAMIDTLHDKNVFEVELNNSQMFLIDSNYFYDCNGNFAGYANQNMLYTITDTALFCNGKRIIDKYDITEKRRILFLIITNLLLSFLTS